MAWHRAPASSPCRRRGILAGPLALGALLCAPAPAVAQTTVLARAGIWQAFSLTTADNQTMCGIMGGEGTHALMVKHVQGQDGAWLEIARRGWRIPARAQPRITIEMDGRVAFTGSTIRNRRHADMLGQDFSSLSEGAEFVRRLGQGTQLRVVFHEGDETPWLLPLAGSREVSAAFAGCLQRLYPAGLPQAAPRAAPPPRTQPFDARPAARQDGPPKSPAP